MRSITAFTGIEPDEGYWELQSRRDESRHRRAHRNESLETFGLSVEEIRKDLKTIYERYELE